MRKLLLLLLLLCPLTVMAQGGGQQGGYPSYRYRRLAADPATCTGGDVYFNYVTGTYRKCPTTNTWVDDVSGTFSSPLLGPNGTAAAPTYSFSSDPNTGIFRSGADAIGFSTGGTERWTMSSSGGFNCTVDGGCDIGNGAADPRDLSLKRNLILRGSTSGAITFAAAATTTPYTFTWPNAAGTSSTFLRGDGTWAAAGGIGGTVGTTDNRVPRADGTGGATLQGSTVQIFDGGSLWIYSDDAFPFVVRDAADSATRFSVSNGGNGDFGGAVIAGGYSTRAGGSVSPDYFQDRATAKGYFDTTAAGINWLNVNRVTTNVNVAVDAMAAQTADLQQWRNSSAAVVAAVKVTGGFLGGRAVSAKTTDYTVLATEPNTFFNNTGAGAGVTFTLPTPVVGMTYEFYRDANQTVTVDVTAGITIRVGASVTTSGGNVTLDAVGSRIRIVAISTTQWVGDLSGTATFN